MSPRALRLELVPSLPLAAGIILAHGAAAACTLTVLSGISGASLAVALLLLGFVSACDRALLCLRRSVRAVVLGEGASIEVELRSGERLAAEASSRRYVHRLAVALPIGRPVRRTILVTRDMLGRDAFRKLRIWALWGRLGPMPGEQAAA